MTLNLKSRRFLGQFGLSLLFLLLLAGHVGQVYNLFFVAKLDAALYDLKLRLFRPQTVDERVVIVDIDDKSLKEIGRWPWPREQVAKLTRNLFEQYGVAAVGYDVVFSEPDQSSGLPVLERMAKGPLAGDAGFAASLARIRPQLDYDGKLADALASGPSILGYYFNFVPPVEINGQLPTPLFPCADVGRQGVIPRHAAGYNGNLKRLQERAGGAAFYNMEADFDGVARRMPVLMEYAGQCYGSLRSWPPAPAWERARRKYARPRAIVPPRWTWMASRCPWMRKARPWCRTAPPMLSPMFPPAM